jgi:hypothetical protein
LDAYAENRLDAAVGLLQHIVLRFPEFMRLDQARELLAELERFPGMMENAGPAR